jgi:myo-inositol-1(or 4)-monophosphatase
MGMEDLAALSALATRIAIAAGDLLADRPAELTTSTKSSPTDVVTQMDQASERLITEMIRSERPHDGILGEEGADHAGTSGLTWVVDPLDGTVNYLYDLPAWAVSIGIVRGEQVLVGVVYAPVLRGGELYRATKGGGAFCNDRRITASKAEALSDALLATGFTYDARQRVRQAAILAKIIGKVRDVRRMGAAALDLCHVASGRVDGYFEAGLKPWDLAAGDLIASEAGAYVTGLRTARADGSLVVAAGSRLHIPLRELLLEFDADRT